MLALQLTGSGRAEVIDVTTDGVFDLCFDPAPTGTGNRGDGDGVHRFEPGGVCGDHLEVDDAVVCVERTDVDVGEHGHGLATNARLARGGEEAAVALTAAWRGFGKGGTGHVER